MANYAKNRSKLIGICALGAVVCLGAAGGPLLADALTQTSTTDLIAQTQGAEWFHNPVEEGTTATPGTWSSTAGSITVDAQGGNYAMQGATYLSPKGQALGAYEMEASFVINELYEVENPMIGIVPWYVDEDNYLFVQLKFSWADQYKLTADDRADGYGLQEIIVSGRLNGEAKYNSATAQQENTVFDATGIANRRNPLSAQGHTLKVEAEQSGSSGNFTKFTISYNGTSVGNVSAYYYNKIYKTAAMGFMAQDVNATFTSATFTDGYAENRTASLARDWMEKDGFVYRTLAGEDAWTIDSDGSVTVDSSENYSVTGTNFGTYNTNRGYTENPYAVTSEGLPQNYEVSATFKVNELVERTSSKEYKLGYGLIPWMQDDQNFVSATIRRTEKGSLTMPSVAYEVVLYGWIDCSNLGIGTTVYKLPNDFDVTEEHTLRVQKKSVGFFVYLDDGEAPIIQKRIAGTDENFGYGYEGYAVDYTATAIESRAIYQAYDEISSYDEEENIWKNAGKSQISWTFDEGTIALDAKETAAVEDGVRSYLLGTSEVTDKNLTLTATVQVSLGQDDFAEVLLAPYVVDEFNFVRAGIAWKNGTPYARIYACTYTEEDEDEGRDPAYTLKEMQLSAIDLTQEITLSAVKVGNAVGIELNGELVYGLEIADIGMIATDIGVYAYNVDLDISDLQMIGYKKYTQVQVGDWLTSGIKNNQWTINSEGYMVSDCTYDDTITPSDKDDDKNWALQANAYTDYTVTATVRVTAESRAQDRVGIMVWYLDEENYLMFFMDKWRSDSTVPRTTFTGLINGEYLPTRYNHGGWFPEGDAVQSSGLTITEESQLDQWHTVSVTKSGNTFTCSVDGTKGLLTYRLPVELPSAAGRTVYSGLYVLNDKVEFSEYALTPAGQTEQLSTPADPSQATSTEEETLTLGTYQDADYTDEFDGVTTSAAQSGGTTPPADEDPTEPPAQDPTDDPQEDPEEEGGCGSVVIGGMSAVMLALGAGAVVFARKRK